MKRTLLSFATLSLCLLFPGLSSAQSIEKQIVDDYAARTDRPRTTVFPKRTLIGRPPSPDTYETPNGNKISHQVSILKPPPLTSDGLYKTGFYSDVENTYWVNVTGGIAGFNYWEGPFKLGATGNFGELKFDIVAGGAHSGGGFGAIGGAANVVIRDDAAWTKLTQKYRNLASATKPDFSKEMAVGVFMGSRSTGGYGIKVTKITRSAPGSITVDVTSRSPGPGEIVTQAFTSPYQVVKLTKYTDPVSFNVTSNSDPLGPLKTTTIDQGSISQDFTNQPRNLVFRDAQSFKSFWSKHSRDPLPKVDFKTETVVAAMRGQRPSGGYGIQVNKVTRTSAGNITVDVEYKNPQPGSFATTIITYPFHIVRFNSTKDTIKFKVIDPSKSALEFTEIGYVRSNASSGKYEYLSIDASGKAVYELRGRGGFDVKTRHTETLVARHVKQISDQIKAANFYNQPNPSLNPAPQPAGAPG